MTDTAVDSAIVGLLSLNNNTNNSNGNMSNVEEETGGSGGTETSQNNDKTVDLTGNSDGNDKEPANKRATRSSSRSNKGKWTKEQTNFALFQRAGSLQLKHLSKHRKAHLIEEIMKH